MRSRSIRSSRLWPAAARSRGKGAFRSVSAAPPGRGRLDVRDVDLQRLYAPLVTTRLSGRLVADLDLRRQTIRGDVADRTISGGVALDFVAAVADGTLAVDRFRARSGKGELTGSGRIALSGERAFELDATARRLDPARFGAFPAGALDGRIVASGTLAPAWRVRADIALARGSRLAGVALAGTARGSFARGSMREVAIDLSAGTVEAHGGSAGEADERIAVALEAPDLAELAPFLPAGLPRPARRRAARARRRSPGAARSSAWTWKPAAKHLKLPGGIAFGALGVRARVAPGAAADDRGDLAARTMRVDVTATGFVTPEATFATMRAGFTERSRSMR